MSSHPSRRGTGPGMGMGRDKGFCCLIKASPGERDGKEEDRHACIPPSPLRPPSKCNFHLEPSRSPSVKDWLNNWYHLRASEYYMAIKKNVV